MAVYCDKKCQAADWKHHKKNCVKQRGDAGENDVAEGLTAKILKAIETKFNL